MILIGKMDSLMVTGFLGLTSVAVYTTAFYMATVIEIPKRAITQATTTLLARAFEKNDLQEIETLYRKTAINQLIIGMLLMIGIWANLESLFILMPKGEIYRAGSQVVILVGIAKLIDMAFGPSSEIIGLSRFYWFNLVCVSLLAVVVVITNYFFIPRFGITGAAYGSVIALIMYNAVKFIFIYLRMGIHPFTFATVKVVLISSAVVLMCVFLPRVHNVFADVLYRSAVITVVFSILIIGTRSSEEVNKIFRQVLTFIGLKK
jgi:O-antigen/teichoic acid export membrane protein